MRLDWQESEQRRDMYDRIAQQTACNEHRARRQRRKQTIRRCLHWANPLVQIVSDVGKPR